MARLFHFEHRGQPLASPQRFSNRVLVNTLWGLATIVVALGAGMLGYMWFEGMGLIDAFANAAMILSGMGPLVPLQHDGAKIFAGIYAIICGLLIFAVAGLILAPVFHRLLHRFHIDETSGR